MQPPLPVLFLGHGTPMYAVQPNPYATAWRDIGKRLPRPKAILAISAHWYVNGTAVTAMEAPRTIHDFGGFPADLYAVEYPAPGSPELAQRVGTLTGAGLDATWGLDHGTWAVLRHMYPEADIPVVQLSLNHHAPPRAHFELGQRLAPLREEGVLIVGSGNVVHNLRAYSWHEQTTEPYDWAERFETTARRALEERDFDPLIDYPLLGRDAELSVPTPDHYLPLLYVMGASNKTDAVSFPVEGFDGGSMSMLAVEFAAG